MKELSFTFRREVIREDLKDDRVFARKRQGDVQSWQSSSSYRGSEGWRLVVARDPCTPVSCMVCLQSKCRGLLITRSPSNHPKVATTMVPPLSIFPSTSEPSP